MDPLFDSVTLKKPYFTEETMFSFYVLFIYPRRALSKGRVVSSNLNLLLDMLSHFACILHKVKLSK
jgi:hypothetical protein